MFKYISIILLLASCDSYEPVEVEHESAGRYEVYHLKCNSGGQVMFDKMVFNAYIGRGYVCFLNEKSDAESSCVTADCVGIYQGREN